MDQKLKSLLYRNPHLYEAMYPQPDQQTYADPAICARICRKYLDAPPKSILDVGCGTGRYLNYFSNGNNICTGVDYLQDMVDFARSRYDHIEFLQGDMRKFRLGRTFDFLICTGSTFLHALSNEDIQRTLETFAIHSNRGGLLILDIKNFIGFIDVSVDKEIQSEIDVDGFRGKSVTTRTFDRKQQRWLWQRTWYLQGQEPVADYLEFRMLFPQEISLYLHQSGFTVLEMFDNPDLKASDLTGERLHIAASYTG